MQTQLNAAGYTRLAIYAISAMVGLAAVVTTTLGMGDLGTLLGAIAGAGAAVTGGTAAFNLPKAPDQHKTAGFDLGAVLSALPSIMAAAQAYNPEKTRLDNIGDAGPSDLPTYDLDSMND